MSKEIRFYVGGNIMRATDVARIDADMNLYAEMADAVVQTISTEVEVKIGDTAIHLAMLLDPDHWDDDWRERGVEDVDAFLLDAASATPSG